MTFTRFAPSQASNFALFPPTSSEYYKKQFSYHPLGVILIKTTINTKKGVFHGTFLYAAEAVAER